MTKPALLVAAFSFGALSFCAFTQTSKKQTVDRYSAEELTKQNDSLAAKKTPFASADLERYGNHYTMFAYRSATGSAEVHEHEADIFVIESGTGKLLEGGTVVAPTTTKPGEIRGSSLKGAQAMPVAPGTIFHIPAGVPHQMIVDQGHPIGYFVVKVTGQ